MIIVSIGWLPGDMFAVWGWALEPIEIDSHDISCSGLSFVDLLHWDAHLAIPEFLVTLNLRFHFKSGIPLPIMIRRVRSAIYFKVHPFALRGDLKFGIFFDVLEVCPDEDFCHIPFPEPVGLGCGCRV